MGTTSDYFVKVGSPGTATTMSAPGHSIGGAAISVGSTANWPGVGETVIFAIDTVTIQTINGVATEVRNANSYTEWQALVTSSTGIGSMVLRYGTDQNYPSGSTTRVYIPVASSRENRLVDGIAVQHNQNGTHSNVTATTVTTTGLVTAASLSVAGSASFASGTVSASALTIPYKFLVYLNAATNTNAQAIVQFDTKLYDTGSNVDVVTNKGRFTAPVTGYYYLKAVVGVSAYANAAQVTYFYKNGVQWVIGPNAANSSTIASIGTIVGGDVFPLTAGDYVEVQFFQNNGAAAVMKVGLPLQTYFSGHLVSTT
jgi:hypothetical protein